VSWPLSPLAVKIGTSSGPVENTRPVRKPTTAPATAICQVVNRHRSMTPLLRTAIIAMKNAASAPSTTAGGIDSRVWAPRAAAGTPGRANAITGRQAMRRHHAITRPTFPITAAMPITGTATRGP
jgi:hypothetical protein